MIEHVSYKYSLLCECVPIPTQANGLLAEMFGTEGVVGSICCTCPIKV